MSNQEMLRVLRDSLARFGRNALQLAETLGTGSKELDSTEWQVIKLTVNMLIQDIMEEAIHFAIYGQSTDFQQAVRQVASWIEYRDHQK